MVRIVIEFGRAAPASADGFAQWFAERVSLDADALTPALDFFADYRTWCLRHGVDAPLGGRAFGDAMADRQIIRSGKRADGRVLRKGASLRPAPAPDAACPPDAPRRSWFRGLLTLARLAPRNGGAL